MKAKLAVLFIVIVVAAGSLRGAPEVQQASPVRVPSRVEPLGEVLPSWNDGPAKKAIVDFVARVTQERGREFVPIGERIAVFDNDGTLWVEQPIYTQLAFAFDRIKALASKHPEWAATPPFKAVLDGDMNAMAASGEKGIAELLAVTHTGNTTEEFDAIVRDWIASARHPRTKRLYTLIDDGPGKRPASSNTSAAVRLRRSATPTVTSKCSSGRRQGKTRASA